MYRIGITIKKRNQQKHRLCVAADFFMSPAVKIN